VTTRSRQVSLTRRGQPVCGNGIFDVTETFPRCQRSDLYGGD
jgi:hypothetical protein